MTSSILERKFILFFLWKVSPIFRVDSRALSLGSRSEVNELRESQEFYWLEKKNHADIRN